MIGDGLASVIAIPAKSGAAPRAKLVLRGVETCFDVPGAVLDAAFQVGDETLLFLTDDVPFEEGLNICLVDQKGSLLDCVALAAAGATGSLHHVRRLGQRLFAFSFFTDTPMQVVVWDVPRIALPQIGLRKGIHRAFSLKGRLSVARHGRALTQQDDNP